MRAQPTLSRRLLWPVVLLTVAIVVLGLVLSSEREPGTLLNIFSTRFLGIFIEAVPFLLLGTLASGLIDSFLHPDDIARLVPKNPFLGTLMGTFMGFAFPVCECGVVPVVRRLYSKGLPMSVGVTFLLAAPVVNPVVLVSTYVAYGFGSILVGRFALTILIAMIVGLVFAIAARPRDVLRPGTLAPAPVFGGSAGATTADMLPARGTTIQRKALLPGILDALRLATDEFFDMGRYLVVGTLLAAGLQTFVSQDTLLTLGSGPVISVIAMLALAFLLSVCSTVDAFLSLAFVGTFTNGSILAFLVFGPMVDIKSMLMFAGVFRRKVVLYLVLLPLLLTLLTTVWLNLNVAL
jgi:hypothetical protein